MCAGDRRIVWMTALLGGIFVLLGSLANPRIAHANGSPPVESNCVNCHENLYYLHDTGKWFCLNESPMACVDCHGGNPAATVQEEAHASRAAHPIINGDITKCQECHPEACNERVQIFRREAGISPVLVAASYVSAAAPGASPISPITVGEGNPEEPAWPEAVSIAVLVVFVLTLVLTSWIRNRKAAG